MPHNVMVPVDLLFAYVLSDVVTQVVTSGPAPGNSVRAPLVALPAMEMVNYAVKGEGDIRPYYRHCVRSGLCDPSLGMEGFVEQARRRLRFLRWNPFAPKPTISTIDQDCLMVQEGIESCCMFKAMGRSWMKVSLSEEAYARWLARDTKDLDAVVARTSRKLFYNPVDHPSYRRIRVARRDSIRLDRIRQLLGPLGPGLRGLDIGCNMGYTAHHLQRQGFRMTGVDYDENHLAVAQALNTTYGLDVRFEHCYFRQFEAEHPFDITVALTVLYHMFYRQEEQNIPAQARLEPTAALQKIDALTRHALIWESGPEPRREIDFIRSNSGLCEYHALGLTQGTGKRRELGVFLRPGTEVADYLKWRCGQDLAD